MRRQALSRKDEKSRRSRRQRSHAGHVVFGTRTSRIGLFLVAVGLCSPLLFVDAAGAAVTTFFSGEAVFTGTTQPDFTVAGGYHPSSVVGTYPALASDVSYPCLTEGTDTAQPPSGAPGIPGCGFTDSGSSATGYYDFHQDGGLGALRLTTDEDNQSGAAFYHLAVPTAEGLDITFDTFQYSTTTNPGPDGQHEYVPPVGDGIAFDLAATNVDNPSVPTTIGTSAGSLGYSTNSYGVNSGSLSGSSESGLTDGYLGFGLDVSGNYANVDYSGSDCAPSGGAAQNEDDGTDLAYPLGLVGYQGYPSPFPEQLTVKGPGNGDLGYCVLDSTATALSYDTNQGNQNSGAGLVETGTWGTGSFNEGGQSGSQLITDEATGVAGPLTPTYVDNGTDVGGDPNNGWWQGESVDSFDQAGRTSDYDRDTSVQVQVLVNTSNITASPATDYFQAFPSVVSGANPPSECSAGVQAGYWGICVIPIKSSDGSQDPSGTIYMSDQLPVVTDNCTESVNLSGDVTPACADTVGGATYYTDLDSNPDNFDSAGYPSMLTLGFSASTGSPQAANLPSFLGTSSDNEIHDVGNLTVKTANGQLPLLGINNCDSENSSCPVTSTGNWTSNGPITFKLSPKVATQSGGSASETSESKPITINDRFPLDTQVGWSSPAVAAGDADWKCGATSNSVDVTAAPATCTATSALTATYPDLVGATMTVDCSTAADEDGFTDAGSEQLECTDTPSVAIDGGASLPSLSITGATVTAAAGSTLESVASIYSEDGFPATSTDTGTVAAGSGGSGGGGGSSNPIPTSTVVTPTPSSTVNPATAVTYTATVTPTTGGATVDGGTISFYDGSTSNPIVGCQGVAVSNGTGRSVATCSATYAAVGTHTILALYSGDATYGPSQGSTVENVVSDFIMTASATPSVAPAGNPITLTAQGIPSGATGTVTFTSGGATLCSYDLVTATSCQTSTALPASNYPVTATYSGDAAHHGATATTTFTLTGITPLSAITPFEHPVGMAVSLPGTPKIASQPPPIQGSCSVNADGSIEFTPAVGFSGVSVCTYTLTTNGLTSLPATVTVTVLPAANPKVFPGPGPTTTSALPHPDGTGPFTYRIIKQPPASEGTCSISQTGQVTFNRNPTYKGTAICTYAVVDGKGSISNEATITILGGSEQVAIQGQTPQGVCITLHTKLPSGNGPFTFTLTSQVPPADGTGSFSPDGSYKFCPTPAFTGDVAFTYIVKNAAGQPTPGSVNILVGTSGTVIPGAHTGEDWSSPLYWYAVAAAGVVGGGLVVSSRFRRSEG